MSHTAYKSSDIYRKKIRLRPFITIPVGILLFCLAVFLMLFYGLQRYVVYEQDGVYIDFNQSASTDYSATPLLELSSKTFEPVAVEIEYHEMDFVNIETSAGTDLTSIRALHIDSADVTTQNLAALTTQAQSIDANALVLEMKNTTGVLGWNSGVTLSTAYGTNGNLLIEPELETLHNNGIYLVAQISCFVDDYMALRNMPIVLATSEGTAYSDSVGRWLDPTNPDTRSYITDLCVELIALGFDEIMLDNFELPQVSGETQFSYYQTGSYVMTPEIAITSFAQELRDDVEAAGGKLSINCDTDSFRNSLQSQTGQVPSAITKIFDRLYFSTDANTVSSDLTIISDYFTPADIESRFVPYMYDTSSTQSWMYPYTVY